MAPYLPRICETTCQLCGALMGIYSLRVFSSVFGPEDGFGQSSVCECLHLVLRISFLQAPTEVLRNLAVALFDASVASFGLVWQTDGDVNCIARCSLGCSCRLSSQTRGIKPVSSCLASDRSSNQLAALSTSSRNMLRARSSYVEQIALWCLCGNP